MTYSLIVILSILQFVHYPFPEDMQGIIGWSASDLTILILAALVTTKIDRVNNTRIYCLSLVFTIWQAVIFAWNLVYISTTLQYIIVSVEACIFLTWLAIIASRPVLSKHVTDMKDGEYYIIYGNTFTAWSFLGSVLPRMNYLCTGIAVYADGHLWAIHNGRFTKLKFSAEKLLRERYTRLAIYATSIKTNKDMNAALDSFVGKFPIPLFRDCVSMKKVIVKEGPHGTI